MSIHATPSSARERARTFFRQLSSLERRLASALHALALSITVLLALPACTATSQYMSPVASPAPPLQPSAGKALVVFSRASSLASGIIFSIIDQSGRFVGDATANSHFPVELPPGEYLFIAKAENTAVAKGTLAADRIYYLQVVPKMGILRARVGLEPLKPSSPEWAHRDEQLSATQRFLPLASQGQANVDAHADDVRELVQQAQLQWNEYSSEERAHLTFGPEDGSQSVERAAPAPGPADGPSTEEPETAEPQPAQPAGAQRTSLSRTSFEQTVTQHGLPVSG